MINEKPKPPVILLAYANDRADPSRHLRSLADECEAIQAALTDAEHAGNCEVRLLANAKPDHLYRAFQSEALRNRIAILHYAGHADGHRLLFETSGDQPGTAGAAALARFLALQPALQLVFLNGCSTRAQVDGLRDAGCRAVIATDQAIDDGVAMRFAERFYRGLGSGNTGLERAYREAVAATEAESPDGMPRGVIWDGDEAAADRWPWDLIEHPSATGIGDWSLAAASGDSLFGLPAPSVTRPPVEPFLGLKWFTREHAPVFFGHGRAIRALYDAVTRELGDPIILFYGQSGVGKSSVLDAGLLPRLEISHRVDYLRRDKDLGLLGTLRGAFAGDGLDLAAVWRAEPRGDADQPRLIVLDQLEEVFTRPNPSQPTELKDLVEALARVFPDTDSPTQDRLILGFRKEWLPEIAERLREHGLGWKAVFVEPLGRADIIEAITGPASSPRLRDTYRLEIDPGLAGEIADDLLADPGSPLAPTLQILLTKLWDEVQDHHQRRFTRDLYLKLKREGILLGDFLDQQLGKLGKDRPEPVKSGLVLDLLAHHASPKGAAIQHDEDELAEHYRHSAKLLPDLIAQCKHRSLLADLPELPDARPQRGSRLAHDTLAPLVRERFDESMYPAQQARRILENHAVEWTGGGKGRVLDDANLKLVEEGVVGMRNLTADEERLLEESKNAHQRRRNARRTWKGLGVLSLALIVGALVTALWLGFEAETQRKLAVDEKKRAQTQSRLAVSRMQLSESQSVAARFPERALLLAAEAVKRPFDFDQIQLTGAIKNLRALLGSSGGVPISALKGSMQSVGFFPDGPWLWARAKPSHLRVWNIEQPETPLIDTQNFTLPRFSREGLLAVRPIPLDDSGDISPDDPGHILLWDLTKPEATPRVLEPKLDPGSNIENFFFSPKARWLIASTTHYRESEDGSWKVDDATVLLDLTNAQAEPVVLGKGYPAASLLFVHVGTNLLATNDQDEVLRLWDLENPTAAPVSLPDWDKATEWRPWFNPKGRRLVATAERGVLVWDLRQPGDRKWLLAGEEIERLALDTRQRWLATLSNRGLRVTDLETPSAASVMLLEPGSLEVESLGFDAEGKWLVAGGSYGDLRVWDLRNLATGPRVIDAVEKADSPTEESIMFDPTGRWLVSLTKLDIRGPGMGFLRAFLPKDSLDRSYAYLWDLDQPDGMPIILHQYGRVVEAKFDNQGHYLVSLNADGAARLWNLDNELLGLDDDLGTPILLHGHESPIRSLDFDSSGRWLATGSPGETLRLWDLAHGPLAQPLLLPGHTQTVQSLAFDPRGRWLASGSEDDTLRLWKVAALESAPLVLDHADDVHTVAFGPHGHWFASVSGGATRLWDIDGPSVVEVSLPGEQPDTQTLAFDPKLRWLAAAGTKETVWLRDLRNGADQPIPLTGNQGGVESLVFDPSGESLATGGSDGAVRLWNLSKPDPSSRLLGTVESAVVSVAIDSQGRWLAAAGERDDQTHLWDLKNLDERPRLLPESASDLNNQLWFDTDSRWLATARTDYGRPVGIKLWNLLNPSSEIAQPSWTTGWLLGALALDPNGRQIAGFAYELLTAEQGKGGVRLWDLENPSATAEKLPGRLGINGPNRLAISPDGKMVASASEDNALVLWTLDVPSLIDLACMTAGRNLRASEWVQHMGDLPYQQTCDEFPITPERDENTGES